METQTAVRGCHRPETGRMEALYQREARKPDGMFPQERHFLKENGACSRQGPDLTASLPSLEQ